ncbi:hypothetical protein PAXRUDRAFT_411411 [Paxillus rubicundulus Ve08.2h10]|uniref:Uncharacterized protein n=1 Tax=Paxillus rubicundulus Ve08.2h10 TaxID=930991 RepID=A0A0D0DQV1_9AGAM|nr:hypothetical protein PAXRUDRAFT_411411 [Paxillus rubicundulus Ve08.2h10]
MSTYTHQTHTPAAPLARSGSFFGTIKNIVTAPFNWFAGPEDEFEDTRGKRRRLPVTSAQGRPEDDSLQGRTKRMRVSGPDRDTHPYLDPPRSAFQQPQRTLGYSRHLSKSPKKNLHIPTASATSNQSPCNRRTLSPHPSASHLKPPTITRTMSLDPPPNPSFSSRIQLAPTMRDIQQGSNHTKDPMSISRDVSMSPRHLRVRSSLTPQPSGASFGPVVPPRRERDPHEPPPLTSLMSNPMFVKPPPSLQKPGAAELGKQLTLGSLMDSHRKGHTPVRQSSILFGTGSMTDVSARMFYLLVAHPLVFDLRPAGHLWPVNAAEIALQELEVYKTPLLPTRLKGSATIPDMFVHKEKKQITLMTDDRPVKPRLGTKGKGKDKGKKKAKEAINGTKPYAGEGGMKKWLARRKKEVEEAKQKDEAEAMEDERAEEEQRRKDAEAHEKKREQELQVPSPPPSIPAFAPKPAREMPLMSSLRVGRTRTGRNHIDRPVSRHPGKFSAVFEDEDEDMDEGRVAEQKALEEAAKKVPAFELPAGFTFANEAPIAHDLKNAKEPPITALPFSLTKPAPPSVPPAPMVAEPVKQVQTPPTFSFAPPTPEPAKSVSEPLATMATPLAAATPAAAPSGIPDFFANSSIFAKPTAVVASPVVQSTEEPPKPAQAVKKAPEFTLPKAPEVPSSLLGAPPHPVGTSLFGTPPAPAAPVGPSLFGTPPAANGTSLLGVPSMPAAPKGSEEPAPTLAPPFSFAEPAKSAGPTQAPALSAPVELPKATGPPNHATPFGGTPFSFDAPASAAPVTTTEAPNSGLTFSQPPAAPTTTTPAPATEIPKALFSTQPSTTTFSFDQRPSTAPTGEKPASSGFSFTGTSSAAEKQPAPGFTFGTPTTPTAAPAVAPAFSFGGTPNGSTAADVLSKPFSFGATTPVRPVTPPKVDQEVTMDESPARDIVPNGNDKAPQRPSLSFSFATSSTSAPLSNGRPSTAAPAFSFGQNATINPFAKEEKRETKSTPSFSGFGQPLSTGFTFGQNAPESPAVTSPAAALFHFGQPSPSVASASPFTFGPSGATTFNQPSTASAPASPSTFNRPTPTFAFGTPTTPQPASNPFGFGAISQPTSPANGTTTLPSGTSGGSAFTFGATAGGTAAPAAQNPFGAPAPATGPGGGSLFTMGSTTPAAEGAGARRIKGLPRRGGRR